MYTPRIDGFIHFKKAVYRALKELLKDSESISWVFNDTLNEVEAVSKITPVVDGTYTMAVGTQITVESGIITSIIPPS